MKAKNREPRIVVLGGGTGLSTLLRGLKKYTSDLTAIVAVTDDGGSSGALRRELGVLPPGDIRNCLVALSEEENLMARLFQYRFPNAGSLSGHSFGNLFLTAMSKIVGGFDSGVMRAGEVLAIRGQVLPGTLSSVTLKARLSDGSIVRGESNIGRSSARIIELSVCPDSPPACPMVIEAIKAADGVVIGPGSLYTSVIANLLVKGIVPALRAARVPKIYVCNIMTQPGETSDYSFSDHLHAIEKHAGKNLVDYTIVNSGPIPPGLARRYAKEGAYPVKINACKGGGVVIRADMVSPSGLARHDSGKLAYAIMKTLGKNTGRLLP